VITQIIFVHLDYTHVQCRLCKLLRAKNEFECYRTSSSQHFTPSLKFDVEVFVHFRRKFHPAAWTVQLVNGSVAAHSREGNGILSSLSRSNVLRETAVQWFVQGDLIPEGRGGAPPRQECVQLWLTLPSATLPIYICSLREHARMRGYTYSYRL
jgi:hypothetical protein